ncbi:hypothetical protein [Flavobacterium sp. T12S277]|uniref:hypothetical protein n=1 Tax=Flavobacterium sp. T12S277 TaxID=3402752 RepID=UPI003AE7A7C6
MRIDFKIPEKWNDMTEWQFNAIGRYLFNSRNDKVDTYIFKVAVMAVLLIPKFNIKNIIKAFIFFTYIPSVDFEKYTAFVFDEKDLFTRFPKKIKIGRWPFRKVVFGPGARMSNSTIEELSYADTFYYKWATEKNTDDLHRLTAILYRQKSKVNNPEDVRMPFSSLMLEKNSYITDKIPLHIKFMIAHVYSGCRQNFINRNPNVFPKHKETEESESRPKNTKPYQPFSKIIDAFAMDEVQVFGTHQQVEKVYAGKFLSLYDISIVKQREREALKR